MAKNKKKQAPKNKKKQAPKNVKPKKKLNPYFIKLMDAKKKDKPSFEYTPLSGVDKGKCKLYVKKIIEFGPAKTKTVVYKFNKYC